MGSRRRYEAFTLLTLLTVSANAQTVSVVTNFDSTANSPAYAPLVQGTDGNLYGTTVFGGTQLSGTVFRMEAGGSRTILYSFCAQPNCTDGSYPYGGLVLASDGNFYGTTVQGGTSGYGTIFQITPSGTLTTLHSFTATDGETPYATLLQATDGLLYGTTHFGGAAGYGTIFRISAGGSFTLLHSFSSADGSYPYGGLIQASDGNFYGTTSQGGTSGNGTVFQLTPTGTLSTIYSFGASDGVFPYAAPVEGSKGVFFGTTTQGGLYGYGTVYKLSAKGQNWTSSTLYSFTGNADGGTPYAGLALATDGTLYGTTSTSVYAGGTIYRLTQRGALTTLYTFCSQPGCPDGEAAYATLFQATNGNLYGTTFQGGASGGGVIYSLSLGLAPFLQVVPVAGRVGSTFIVLGNNLGGASSLMFKTTAATFQVVSPAYISTIMPAGARTGTLTVTTPAGTLSSNVAVQVLK